MEGGREGRGRREYYGAYYRRLLNMVIDQTA